MIRPPCDSASSRKIPASPSCNQRFAIPPVPPGHRLPSTRQLASRPHRNTISKVYRQLETDGVVEAMAGSIYVRDQQKAKSA